MSQLLEALGSAIYVVLSLMFSSYVVYYGLVHFIYPVVPELYHLAYPVVIGVRILLAMCTVSEIDVKDSIDNPLTTTHKFALQGTFLISLGLMWVIVNYFM